MKKKKTKKKSIHTTKATDQGLTSAYSSWPHRSRLVHEYKSRACLRRALGRRRPRSASWRAGAVWQWTKRTRVCCAMRVSPCTMAACSAAAIRASTGTCRSALARWRRWARLAARPTCARATRADRSISPCRFAASPDSIWPGSHRTATAAAMPNFHLCSRVSPSTATGSISIDRLHSQTHWVCSHSVSSLCWATFWLTFNFWFEKDRN